MIVLSPIALLVLSFIVVPKMSVEVNIGETESIPTRQPRATERPKATQRSTPTRTPSPTRTPKPTENYTPTRTPRATLEPALEVTVQLALDNVMRWITEVNFRLEYDKGEYRVGDEGYEFGPALVLAVMANESGGNPYALSYAGACGLMQVMPKHWYRYTAGQICSNYSVNIAMGIWILHSAINNAKEQGYDLRYGLAYYNCSEQAVHEDRCGSRGGLNYADRVLEFWLPFVEERVAQYEGDL